MRIHNMKNKTAHKVATPVFNVNENVSLEEQIAHRAHELWQHRGREHGSDLGDWLRAEREVNDWHQKRLQSKTQSNAGLASG